MSELPKGWESKRIEELCEFKNGIAFKSSWFCEKGTYQVLKLGNVKNGRVQLGSPLSYLDDEYLQPYLDSAPLAGEILISMTGTRFKRDYGFVGRIPKNAKVLVNQRVGRLIVDKQFDGDFLFHYLRSRHFREQFFSGETGGVNQGNVGSTHIQECKVPVPPLAEQTRIVEKLDEVLAQVDTIKARLDGIPALLKRFRQSVLASAVSGKLTEEWRKKNIVSFNDVTLRGSQLKHGKSKYKIDLFNQAALTLPELPDVWKIVPAGELFSYVTSGSRGWAKYYAERGSLFVRMTNLNYLSTELDLSDVIYVDLPDTVEGKRSLIEQDDLLISITADVGRVAHVSKDIGEAYINQHVALARPNLKEYSEYISLCIAAENIGIKQVDSLKRGATKAGLGLDDIRSFAIPLPSINEAQEIVRLVDKYFAFADTIEAQVKKAQARVNNLTQSILAKAFRGELVPQDPNDEPADKLLERIAQARSEAETLAKATKKALSAKNAVKKKAQKV